jgi:hypothetical protein
MQVKGTVILFLMTWKTGEGRMPFRAWGFAAL